MVGRTRVRERKRQMEKHEGNVNEVGPINEEYVVYMKITKYTL